MKYALTYRPSLGAFSVHRFDCARVKHRDGHTHLVPETFASIDGARNYANGDESERAGEPRTADVLVCRCAFTTGV